MNPTEYYQTKVSKGRSSRLVFPLMVFFVLFALNVYFWSDYFSRKNKISLIQKDTNTLLSATAEDQDISLEDNQKKLAQIEKQNFTLTTELASTTSMLASTETELLKYDTELIVTASSTEAERETEKIFSGGITLTSVKNVLSSI